MKTEPALSAIAHALARSGAANLVQEKHPRSICVINYKGGVGKTTVTTLLGVYLAQKSKKKVLLIDIDPQCSLSLALGEDPEAISKTDHTIYNLVEPSAWTKLANKTLSNYAKPLRSKFLPRNLHLLPGSFNTDELDILIAQTLIDGKERFKEQLFLLAKQLLMGFREEYEYVLVDCPPNKMFLTQAMLRACSFYLPVTIPDMISIYGMPRLVRWVLQIQPVSDRPKMLGYVLNVVNRSGGGMVNSQRNESATLMQRLQSILTLEEKSVMGRTPCLGEIPRLDVIARFLGGQPWTISDFADSKSKQPSVDDCMLGIVSEVVARWKIYNASNKTDFTETGSAVAAQR